MSLASFFHVLNPSSHHREKVLEYVRRDPSLRLMWVERASHPTHLETILNWTLVEEERRVCVWGGDGTLNRTLQFYSDQGALDKIELALLPAGTCNDFYRHNFLKQSGLYDLGMVEGEASRRVFINNAGFGRTREALRRKRSNPLKDIWAFRPKRLSLKWKDHQESHEKTIDALLGMICNSPYFSGGLHFSKNVDASDGLINAYFEKPQSSVALLLKFLRGRWGRALADTDTVSISGSQISVKSSEELYIQVDGEPAFQNAVREVNFSCEKNAVRLSLLKPPF